MASPAHCFYCFECLDANYERRDPPTLQNVLDLYDRYEKGTDTTSSSEAVSVRDGDSVDVHDQDGDHEDDAETGLDKSSGKDTRATQSDRARPQLPSISRLQASTSSSRSSSASSPSTVSASSSNTHLTEATSISSVGSRPSYASRLSINEEYPLFVTWNTVSRSGHKSLRGCIGTFEALPLENGLATYALTSALEDTRFSPIPASLLASLSCSLTLLANFEPCQDAMDWTLGIHGLRISFTYRNRRHGATYLPDVAVEQGWSKEETVESLMKKAGWDGNYGHGVARRLLRGTAKPTEQQSSKPWDEVSDFRAIRYTGLKSSASYSEWTKWHEWIDEQGETLA